MLPFRQVRSVSLDHRTARDQIPPSCSLADTCVLGPCVVAYRAAACGGCTGAATSASAAASRAGRVGRTAGVLTARGACAARFWRARIRAEGTGRRALRRLEARSQTRRQHQRAQQTQPRQSAHPLLGVGRGRERTALTLHRWSTRPPSSSRPAPASVSANGPVPASLVTSGFFGPPSLLLSSPCAAGALAPPVGTMGKGASLLVLGGSKPGPTQLLAAAQATNNRHLARTADKYIDHTRWQWLGSASSLQRRRDGVIDSASRAPNTPPAFSGGARRRLRRRSSVG
jgi:hypothetical protein